MASSLSNAAKELALKNATVSFQVAQLGSDSEVTKKILADSQCNRDNLDACRKTWREIEKAFVSNVGELNLEGKFGPFTNGWAIRKVVLNRLKTSRKIQDQ